MSRDPAPSNSRIRWLLLLFLAFAVLALFLWVVLTFRYIGDVVVEDARVSEPNGSRRLGPGDTPRRLAVTFSTPGDLETIRANEGLGFITAKLSACEDGSATFREVVTQGGGYLSDTGRVRKLAAPVVDPEAGRVTGTWLFTSRRDI